MSHPALNADDKARLGALLTGWGRAGAAPSRLASLAGIAQYALFIGFAWHAAGAVAALVDGAPVLGPLLWAAGFAALRAIAQAIETRAGFEASARVRTHVRGLAAAGIAARGPAFTERHETGALGSALIDAVEKLDGYYGRYRPLLPVIAGAPLIMTLAAFTQSWIAGMIFLVTAPLLPLFMAIVGGAAAAASKDQLAVLARLAGRFNDRLQALPLLNAFNAAEREAEGLRAAAEDFRVRTMKVLRLAFLSSAILEFFAALAVAAMAIYVGFSLLGEMPFDTGETITLHQGLFVLILAPEFYMPLRRLSAAYHDRADAEAAAGVLEPAVPVGESGGQKPVNPPFRQAPGISLVGVKTVYEDGRTGLPPVSLVLKSGAISVIWGPSGCGKSTLLKMLMGFAPLSAGERRINGEVLSEGLAARAGWIGQNPRLFHGNIRDNITLHDPSISEAKVVEAAELAGLSALLSSLPKGLDTPVGERGFGLSGGQIQRVALARALARDMSLILMDEPTAHLDGEAEARFLQALRSIAPGRTLIIASHSPAVREIADELIDLAALVREAGQ
ncbi:MAG: thiol reductant ABC exporter subunit CydD [Oceanicaulis sp.]|uniref:thiol reductant ABC exporter subunit CydD n=1 Tax=Glycocaulis sp. TaxID=1969725 RepID=UPI0025C03F43|nr:thiol reductant ABC exporter subunit CydD [Glycocaulis sp.]MCC5981445.1 thiol reductant ABC exporter subunit CydD [Oceanicaulis sp.]MCH8521728.1 thiol reductant ABC exporter subunit CydD [Glycocaulis sp.]